MKFFWRTRSDKALRVSIATRTFTPEPTAAALRLGALARALAASGAEVHVLTSRLGGYGHVPASQGEDMGVSGGDASGTIHVSRAPVLRDSSGAVRGYIPYLSFDIPLFFRLLSAKRPDIVVSEPPPTTGAAVRVACAIRRIPYVYYAADIVSDAAQDTGVSPLVVRVVRALESFALRGARGVISVGRDVGKRAVKLGARRVRVVPNGVEVPELRTVNREVPDGFPISRGPIFIYAGTVAPWLAPEVFIDAFEKVREELGDACVVFLGQGSGWEELSARAAGVEGVLLHPPVSAQEAGEWMRRATASLASIRPGVYSYAYPTKILASLAVGTPVIYAGEGPAAQDVRRYRLGVASEYEVEAVARAMVAFARGDVECISGEEARAWVREHRSVASSSREAAHFVRECSTIKNK